MSKPYLEIKAFLTGQLEDILWSEKELIKILPELEDAAFTRELKNAFRKRSAITRQSVEKLGNIFESMKVKTGKTKSPSMAGILAEAEDVIDETEEGTVQRDFGLILTGYKITYHEIATYTGLIQLAKSIAMNNVADILGQILKSVTKEESLLNRIAENNIRNTTKKAK